MDQNLDPKINNEKLDIVRQIKANGNFDEFRKDCFADITSQQKYRDLTKQVEDFVLKFLKEQNPNDKKTFIREKLRRKLNDSYFITHGINQLIEDIVEPKLESKFKTAFEEIVIKPVLSPTLNPTYVTPSNILHTSPNNNTDSQNKETLKKVSVEDFIPSEKEKKNITPKTINLLSHKLKQTKSMDINYKHTIVVNHKIEKSESKLLAKNKNLSETSVKQQKTSTHTKVKQSPSVAIRVVEKIEVDKKIITTDSILEMDLREYGQKRISEDKYGLKLEWLLDDLLSDSDYDAFSMISSVQSNQITDEELKEDLEMIEEEDEEMIDSF